jgi:hypothetical protein
MPKRSVDPEEVRELEAQLLAEAEGIEQENRRVKLPKRASQQQPTAAAAQTAVHRAEAQVHRAEARLADASSTLQQELQDPQIEQQQQQQEQDNREPQQQHVHHSGCGCQFEHIQHEVPVELLQLAAEDEEVAKGGI